MLMKLWIVFLVLRFFGSSSGLRHKTYRFKLDIGNPNVLCPQPGYVCPNNESHYLCTPQRKYPRCICHKAIPLGVKMKKIFVEGTNGIRNKVAFDWGIGNMNILYWSEVLEDMANRFLLECTRDYDPCLIIGEKQIRVSQNSIFIPGQITDRWPGRVVRHWYLEIGHDVKSFSDFKRKILVGELRNMSNMIYPSAEFVGCSGARLSEGYHVVCYYHPAFNRSTFPKGFSLGKPCYRCDRDRGTCSKTFSSLCGVDYEIKSGVRKPQNFNGILLFALFDFYKSIKIFLWG